MARMSQRRFWVAIMATVLLAAGALADAARARQACPPPVAAEPAATAETCCAMASALDAPAEKGASLCSMQCGAVGCTAAITPDSAAVERRAAPLAAASSGTYSGWRPPPAAPPPRSIVLD